jgi:hypothetical protein
MSRIAYSYSTRINSYKEKKGFKKLFVLFLFISSWVTAQNPTFIAQVSKTKVAVNEVFQIAFTLNGSGNNLVYPNLNDFNIYSGPNQSQSMSMVNGNISQSITLSIFIAAKKEGKFTIGSATVMSSNQKLETKPIVIEVTKAATQQQQNQGSQGTQAQQKQEKNQYASEISNDDLFVRSFLNKSKCYKGEQLHLSHKIYSRYQIIDFGPKQLTKSFEGFWNQVDLNKGNFTMKTEVLNGINYYVLEIYNTYLFAQRTGEIKIDPIEVECVVRRQAKRQPRNIFEQFFGTAGYEDVGMIVKSKSLKVDVQELPSEHKPIEFSGAVGDFGYKVELDKNQIKANEAINLKITVNGKGNIKLIEPLKLNLPESFESYDPKINENVKTVGGVSGSIIYNYLIIPREKGEFTINNLNFNYFNPDKKQYVSIPSPDLKLTVLEGDASSAQIVSPNKKGIKESENDIRYIKTGDLGLQKKDAEFFSSTMHYLLLIFPTLLFFGGLFFVRQHIKANSDITAVKERKAAKLAKKQLTVAEKHMQTNSKDAFFTEVLNALNKYIGDKFALPIADLSKDKIKEMLLYKNVKEETANHLIETLNTCEYAKYAPSSVTGDLKQVYQDTIELISQIEEQIKK